MLKGVVKKGRGRGKELGFPTANIELNKNYPFLKEGVYAAWAYLDRKRYKAAFVVQISKGVVQAHLIDYSGEDFLDKEIELDLVQQISQMEHMASDKELKKKITSDVAIAREVLENEK